MQKLGGGGARLPVRALVVDDEVLIQDLMVPILEDAGMDVVVASSGTEAIAMIEGAPGLLDVLITDIYLGPRCPTGWDVAHHARQVNPTIAVVYMTGANAPEWPSNRVSDSVLLAKPFALAQVIDAVSRVYLPRPSAPSGPRR